MVHSVTHASTVALGDALDGRERLADVGDVGVREPERDEDGEVHALVVVEALHRAAPPASARLGEEEHAAGRAAAVADDRGLRVRDLTFAGVAAQLRDRFVDEAVAVQPPRRQLPAVGVEREHAVEGDVGAAVEEVLRLTPAAEAERLDPRQAVEREAVVELGHVDVGRA